MNLYEDAKLFCDWLEAAEWFDSRGPVKTAEWLGVPREAISRLNSPIDVTFLRRFARASRMESGEVLYEAMRFIGDDLLEFLKGARHRIQATEKLARVWQLDSPSQSFQALFLPRSKQIPEEPSATLARYARAKEMDVAALVYPDRRGNGYGMARLDDHPRLDFSRIREEIDVHFAHVSGFMCKTTATDEERLRSLLLSAWV
jgi:hypothetical protein